MRWQTGLKNWSR